MDAKITAPPSQREVERRFRDLLKQGDIDELSGWLDEPYDTLTKKLNPNNPEAKSDFYKGVRQVWAMKMMGGEEKAWEAINILVEMIFPGADKLLLINRMQGDLERLKREIEASRVTPIARA